MSVDYSAKPPVGLKPSFGRSLAAAFWPIAAFGLASFAVALLVNLAGQAFNFKAEDLYEQSEAFRFGFTLLSNAAVLALAVLPFFNYVFGQDLNWRVALGLARRPKFSDLNYALIAWGVYFAAAIGIFFATQALFSGFDADQAQELGQPNADTLIQYILVFISLVVLPPILEEVLFRGYMFGGLRRQYGFWISAIITSLAFALVHGQVNVGLDVFVLSMASCYIREKTGSLWASIFLHALKNGLAFSLLVKSGAL